MKYFIILLTVLFTNFLSAKTIDVYAAVDFEGIDTINVSVGDTLCVKCPLQDSCVNYDEFDNRNHKKMQIISLDIVNDGYLAKIYFKIINNIDDNFELVAVFYPGGITYTYKAFLTTETITNIEDKNNYVIDYKLNQNYPNPFNPNTTIEYSISKNDYVKIDIYSITGQFIKTIINEYKIVGDYKIKFNGSELASGTYIYRIQAGNFVNVKRMILVK